MKAILDEKQLEKKLIYYLVRRSDCRTIQGAKAIISEIVKEIQILTAHEGEGDIGSWFEKYQDGAPDYDPSVGLFGTWWSEAEWFVIKKFVDEFTQFISDNKQPLPAPPKDNT